ncbi:MAG TPA: phosphotriesterase-related protein [Dehalococcoidia bacterium]|nr:phosphotriesterase-related protein [Dehalococcoidia bacterium]
MARRELKGKVQTVLGLIAPEELGITLPHEHLICDATTWFYEPEEASERRLVRHPVSLEILWWLRYHPFQNWDDLQILDEKVIIDEVLIYKALGGKSIVELTVRGLYPDPPAVARISRITGVNIIMGTAYYVEQSYPATKVDMDAKSEEEIAEEFITDIIEGFGHTGIRAGIIGEIGCSWPLADNEKKVLRAGAHAQKATGAAINVHPGQNEMAAMECIKVLDKAGADLSRVIVSHIDRAVREPKNRLELAKTGCTLEYDLFGREGYYPTRFRVLDIPNDAQRINELKELADNGFQNQLLISQDNYTKSSLCRYGGWGYGHILRDVVPVMKIKGLSQELIDAMLIENPKRLLTFV